VAVTIGTAIDAPELVAVRQDDALAVPLIEELAIECRTCYGGSAYETTV
jgi:hypothetical protein